MTDTPLPRHRPEIPIQYAGQWIAWDAERNRIIASGDSYAATRNAARDAGESKPVLQRVPPRKVRSILAA